MNDIVEAGPAFELVDSESTGSETPLSHHVCKMFTDKGDDEGSIIGPRSILRMRVEREEVPWCDILLEPKAQHYQLLHK